MNRRMLLWGLLIVFVCLPVAAFAQDNVEGGDYYVTGELPDGSTYSGGLEILQYAEEGYYTLSYQLGTPVYGQGILQGNVLSSTFGENCGLASYLIDANTNLSGWWTDVTTGTVNPETATLVSDANSMATFEISGTNASGGDYAGTMTLTQNAGGATATVVQTVGDGTFTGTGIVQNGVLSVAFGEGCGVGSYAVQDNGDLVGGWALVGDTTVVTESATPINIIGAHNITGTNPDGSAYTGTLDVAADNQVHTFNYDINGAFPGVGILRGNTVAVGFGGETCSVASYFVRPNGALVGLWALVGSNETGSEIAVRTDDLSFAEGKNIPSVVGTYTTTGTNGSGADATTYTADLEIIQQGNVYQFIWTFADGTSTEGVGVLSNNTLMVGYGGETCAVNAYTVTPESMDGVWGTYGNNTLGTESATR